jgi:hypothetical protein
LFALFYNFKLGLVTLLIVPIFLLNTYFQSAMTNGLLKGNKDANEDGSKVNLVLVLIFLNTMFVSIGSRSPLKPYKVLELSLLCIKKSISLRNTNR